MRYAALALVAAGCLTVARQEPVALANAAPTFTNDVAPILFTNCASCHRAGEMAPMPLTSFDEVRPWAKAIRKAVTSREMPPWGADAGHNEFANDPSLSAAQIKTIADWVDAGAPEGDRKHLPPLPVFTASWKIGTPDVVLSMPSTYDIPAGGPRILQDFPIATTFAEDKYIEVAEVIPGKRSHTHHAIVSVNDGSGSSRVASYLPGGPTSSLPKGVVKLIPKGAAINLNMHYNPTGVAAKDGDTRIGFRFAKGPIEKVAITAMTGTRALEIPPGAANYEAVGNPYVFKEDSHIISFLPRMNERGKDFTYTLVLPDGTRTVLLKVSKFDDGWQPSYLLKTAVAAPKGSRLESIAHYDNSAGNKRNPDPTRLVKYGPEIMNGYFDFTVDAQRVTAARLSRRRRLGARKPILIQLFRVVTLGASLLAASAAAAQQVEVSPFGGYRFGWGVSNVDGVPVVDDDGGPSFGAVVDIPLGRQYEGMVFEALFSRERARVTLQSSFGAPASAIVEVDHMLIGVSQEVDGSSPRARAFISGLVGLTRYAAASDNDVRFTIGLGAGGKFFATRHLGLRLEARGYMTFVNLSGVGVCSGGCAVAFAYNPVFQADLTAGLIVAF